MSSIIRWYVLMTNMLIICSEHVVFEHKKLRRIIVFMIDTYSSCMVGVGAKNGFIKLSFYFALLEIILMFLRL